MNSEISKVYLSRSREIEKRNEISVALNLTEDVSGKIFSLFAVVKKGESEINGDEIVYGGTINFNAVFAAEELNRAEVGAKFTFKTEKDGEGETCSVRYTVKNVAIKSDGGMLYATCELVALITLYYKEERSFVSSLDVLTKTDSVAVCERTPFKKEFAVDDEFSSKRVKRALLSNACAVVTAVSADDDFVTVDGEVVLNVCLLPFSENSDILKETRIIPFRFEIDADGVDEESVAGATAIAERATLKILVDENSGKTTVTASVSVLIEGCAYSRTEKSYVVDAYSPDYEIGLKTDEICDRAAVGFSGGSERINGKAVCKVPEYSRLVKMIGERIEDYSYRKEGDALYIEGVIAGDVVFSDSENVTVAESMRMPFKIACPCECDAENVSVIIESATAKIRSGEIECDVSLKYSFFKTAPVSAQVVTEAEAAGEKIRNDSVISVYVGKRGDGEWDVIKALGVPPESIYELNSNLSFPLAGGEKITIFRKQ